MNKSKRMSWADADRKYLLHGGIPLDAFAEKGSELIIEEGHGIILRDVYGKEYIDALAGAISVNVGYSRPEMAEVAAEQMKKLSYLMNWSQLVATITIEYSEKLAEFTLKGLDRFFYALSGSEANETAYKIARYYWANQGKPQKNKIISREYSYHGLNLASMSATGMERFHEKLGPLVPGFIRIKTAYCYRCPYGKEYPKCKIECADALAEAIDKEGADTVAAFVAEPIHGTSGTIIPPPEYFPKIKKICDENNVLLVLDEVMTGFGRTGKNFACEHWNIIPDMMLMSKGMISSALPLSAVAITDKIFQGMKGPGAFYHLYTTGANPVTMAVAMKNLEIIINEKLVENSAKVGKYLLKRLRELEESPYVGDVRGLGLFTGFELVEDKKTKVPASNMAKQLVVDCRNAGLLVRVAGYAIQIGPPLIVTESDIDAIMDILKPAVMALKK